ncbi:DUF3560 domain-containing protein [Streptomyces sp. NPDC035033]|uniref:DUF3560 domain-containing protein n=1 Tax=Streptomyces sp. NPDC035033 TaxID=3155368 RepID=UPI0033FC1457
MTSASEARSRARRAREYADRLAAEAEQRSDRASGMYGRFEHGQPLLVGHHSYRSAVRARARADAAVRRAVEARAQAGRARDKAARLQAEADMAGRLQGRGRAWTPADFRAGDVVEVRVSRTRTDLYRVKRVNRASLTLQGPGGGFDDPRRPYDRVLARIRDGVRVTDPATLT